MALKLSTKLLFLSAFSLASPGMAWAAACCGGGFALPSLIVGDDNALLTASFGFSELKKEVGSDSLWRARTLPEQSKTIKIEGSHIFFDRWQAGISLPIVQRSRGNSQSTGLGDVAATFGYEILPEWEYNPWRPRGLAFLQLIAPTGRSINEANSAYQLDSRGRGFFAVGVGSILTKIVGDFDIYSTIDLHRSLPKNFRQAAAAGRLIPGWGGGLGLGGGYSWGDLRLGLGINWAYEQGVDVTGALSSEGMAQRYATASASISYLLNPRWAATVAASDQTLFGSPLNTSLARGITATIQRKWSR